MCYECGKTYTVPGVVWVNHLKQQGNSQDNEKANTQTTFTENKSGANLNGYAYSLEDLLSRASVDMERWEVDTWEIKNNEWDVTMADRDQNLQFEKNDQGKQIMTGYSKRKGQVSKKNKQFYIKVRLKKRLDLTSTEKFRKELIKEIKRYSPKVHTIKKKYSSGNMLEIMIPDLHLGKLGWSRETGEPNYDTKIACTRFNDSVDNLVSKAMLFSKFERIVFVVGNDWFNSDRDYPFPQTTAGTPQHSDERWQKVFKTGRELATDTIDKLASIAPVDVILIPGNHAFQKEFYMGDSLECKYENHSHVNIDNRPTTRKYYNWGDCLIGFEHGRPSDAGMKRIQTLMQYEVPKMWANTRFHEWHMGDIHHWKKTIVTTEEDTQGIILRWMRTLMFNDEWEAKKGYKSQKGAHAFIWNKKNGNEVELRFNG